MCIPIVQVKDGRVVNEWSSKAECARYLKADCSAVCRVISGKQKSINGIRYDLRECLNSEA